MRRGSSIVLTSARRSGDRPVASDSAFRPAPGCAALAHPPQSERSVCSGRGRTSAVIPGPSGDWFRNSALACDASTRDAEAIGAFRHLSDDPDGPDPLQVVRAGSSFSRPAAGAAPSASRERAVHGLDRHRPAHRERSHGQRKHDERRSGRTGSSDGSCGAVPG
jgi:hypothetical protein